VWRIVINASCALGVCLVCAQGCAPSGGVGDPCIPEQEYDPVFLGFDPGEVSVESQSFQCRTRLCLVNHFRGRVTCPYGQDAMGTAPAGDPFGPCVVPGTTTPITGNAAVDPQCVDRPSQSAVYCSCRCANPDWETNDGAIYCPCPSGFSCTQLITPIGDTDPDLAGAYCIKQGTTYEASSACDLPCDPTITTQNCPPAPID
jgi:hypothetical protein